MRAETIAKAFGARKVGGGWMARCPAHEDRNPSLSVHAADDEKVLALPRRLRPGAGNGGAADSCSVGESTARPHPCDPCHAVPSPNRRSRS
jgi:hypothetical protein